MGVFDSIPLWAREKPEPVKVEAQADMMACVNEARNAAADAQIARLDQEMWQQLASEPMPKRKPGRPKGSKNAKPARLASAPTKD